MSPPAKPMSQNFKQSVIGLSVAYTLRAHIRAEGGHFEDTP